MPGEPTLIAIEGGGEIGEALAEIHLVSEDYLEPAVRGLTQAAEDGDVDAVRAYAYEVLVGVGSIIAVCPRPVDAADADAAPFARR